MTMEARFLRVIAIALLIACAGTLLAEEGSLASRKLVVMEDFESYTNDIHVAKVWYKPPHGAALRQSLDRDHKGGGKQSLRIAYTTTKESETHYAPFCRVAKWDLRGCNAVQFWLKPDGSGRQLTFELNIANKEGKNIHDLWSARYVPAKGDTEPRIVTIPFSKLVQNTKHANSPDVSPVFKPEAVIEVAFYIGGRKDEPGEGVYCFDEIVARWDPSF